MSEKNKSPDEGISPIVDPDTTPYINIGQNGCSIGIKTGANWTKNGKVTPTPFNDIIISYPCMKTKRGKSAFYLLG